MPEGPARAAIALGSNLPSRFGDPEANLREAVRRLSALGTVQAVSTFRHTQPVGYLNQPDFLNGALLLETQLQPRELLHQLHRIEAAMGRTRAATPPKGPRIIDLDLLLYDGLALHTPALTLPHPALHQRRFVLEPLAEVAPGWLHPTLHRTVADLLHSLPTTPESPELP